MIAVAVSLIAGSLIATPAAPAITAHVSPHHHKAHVLHAAPRVVHRAHHYRHTAPTVDVRTRGGVLVNPGSVASAALRLAHAPRWWKGGVMTIMNRESSNRPDAINNWDGNAAMGADMRSKGLMQTVGPTFRANHVRGTSWNILDPVANCASAIKYIQHRYGSINNVQQANPNLPPKGY